MSRILMLLSIVSTFVLSSCSYTEEITFNEDGSGEFVLNYDMSDLMSVLKKMGGDKPENQKKEKVDSIISLREIFAKKADSIAKLPQSKQDELNALANIMMRIQSDDETGDFNMSYSLKFESFDELPDILGKIQKAKESTSNKDSEFNGMESDPMIKSITDMLDHVDYTFDGKQFSRSLKEGYEPSPEAVAELDDKMEQMKKDSKDDKEMTYTFVYHFPKAIKSVSNPKAKISADKKSVTLTQTFVDMIKSPELNTLKVDLKD